MNRVCKPPCVRGNVAYPAPRIPSGTETIWLSHTPVRGVFGPALSLNLTETPSLNLPNGKNQSSPTDFESLLL